MLFGPRVHLVILFTSDCQWYCLAVQGARTVTQHVVSVESSSLILYGTFRDLFVFRGDSLTHADRTTNYMF